MARSISPWLHTRVVGGRAKQAPRAASYVSVTLWAFRASGHSVVTRAFPASRRLLTAKASAAITECPAGRWAGRGYEEVRQAGEGPGSIAGAARVTVNPETISYQSVTVQQSATKSSNGYNRSIHPAILLSAYLGQGLEPVPKAAHGMRQGSFLDGLSLSTADLLHIFNKSAGKHPEKLNRNIKKLGKAA